MKIDNEDKQFSKILKMSFGVLYIPFNQRPYEWTKELCERLLNDFISLIGTEKKHDIHQITLYYNKKNGKHYVSDGQQRIITSLLILIAVIRILEEMLTQTTDVKRKREIEFLLKSLPDQFLLNVNIKTLSTQTKIMFESENTNTLWRHLTDKHTIPSSFSYSDYEIEIGNNFTYINELLINKLNQSEDAFTFLHGLVTVIIENVSMVLTVKENLTEATIGFDSLNTASLPLKDYYALRNKIIISLGEYEAREFIYHVDKTLDGLNKNKFIHFYANVINGKTSEKISYMTIVQQKILNKTPAEIKLFMIELSEAAFAYKLLFDFSVNSRRMSTIEGKTMENYLSILTFLNSSQFKSIFMSLNIKKFKPHDINLILKEIISLQMRNIFICKCAPNTLERFYPFLANCIYQGEILPGKVLSKSSEFYGEATSVKTIIGVINNEMVSDDILKDHFLNRLIITRTDEKIARYMIRSIYDTSNDSESLINPNADEVNLEHIFPKRPHSDWFNYFSEEEFEDKYHIGNLTVIHDIKNKEASNLPFKEKRKIIRRSSIPQNKIIARNIDWTHEHITERTSQLYEEFLKIWSKDKVMIQV